MMILRSARSYFSILSLSLFSIPASPEYTVARDLYLKSFSTNQDRHVESLEEIKKKNKKLTLQVTELSEGEKRKIAFDILSKNMQPSIMQTALDGTFLKKMEIFCGGELSSAHLMEKLNHTRTVFGEAALAALISQPTFDKNILTSRQATIKQLIQDKELIKEIDTVLCEIKKSESLMFSYWQDENPVNEELFKKVYYPETVSWLNTNATALEATVQMRNALTAIMINIFPIYAVELAAITKYQQAAALGAPISKFEAVRQGIASINPTNIKYALNLLAELPNQTKATLAGVGGAMVGLLGYSTYKTFDDTRLNNNIARHLQTKLIDVATYINSLSKLSNILEQHEASGNPVLGSIRKSLSTKDNLSAYAEKLKSFLMKNTFIGKASFFSLTGRVLAAHQLMKEVKEEFGQAMSAAGYLDAYLSIAKLYLAHESDRVHYSFAKFVEADKPYVHITDFWNPFVNADIVVTNDLTLGTETLPNNMILTGPNTGGKSTIIKGAIINLLLAQTIGIVPAKQLIMTPFVNINCYLNITDDIATGTSLFKAEVMRAKTLIESIRKLSTQEFSFTIMDEVFSGTSPKEGEEAAYLFAKELSKSNNSITCIATHYHRLTELENEKFKNYQVTVLKTEDGSLVRPFKLEEGKSTINIAFDLLAQEGIFSSGLEN
ncbi:MAG TPA: hypothetical protein VHO47_01165 [Candidatus Babeliales bacterium]|nr:hypothetical protein [Candidatus Babeliales bacterium]